MSVTAIIIIVMPIAMILGGILLLKKSARKFDISKKDLEKIKQRNKEVEQQEADDNR